jgi:hypothetical protein
MSALNGYFSAGWNSPLLHCLGEEPVQTVPDRIEALSQREPAVQFESDNSGSDWPEINGIGLMWQLR